MHQRHYSGFTLIEMMIVVVIMGVLAAIVYPNYTDYVRQTRRSDAQVALTTLANQQEKFMTECSRYAPTLTGARTCGATAADGVLGGSALSPDRHYAITITAGIMEAGGGISADCGLITCGYTLIADPDGGGTTTRQQGDGKFMINSLGQKFWDRNDDDDYSDANESKWTK